MRIENTSVGHNGLSCGVDTTLHRTISSFHVVFAAPSPHTRPWRRYWISQCVYRQLRYRGRRGTTPHQRGIDSYAVRCYL